MVLARHPLPTLLRVLLGAFLCLALSGSSCRVESCSGDACGGEGGEDDDRTRTLVMRPMVVPAPGPVLLLVPGAMGPFPGTPRD